MVATRVEELGELELQVGWSWKTVVEQARKSLAQKGFPQPTQPTSELEDLGTIENIENLVGLALANLTIRYHAWYSYATVELAYTHAANKALDEILDIRIGREMHILANRGEGPKPTKEVLRALAIDGNEGLKAWFRKKVQGDQQVRLLEGTVKGLEIRCRALESEQIRRATAQKLEGGR